MTTPADIPPGQLPERLLFNPIPQWEFGQQRTPYEKPLFYITILIDHIDPRVKAFNDIRSTTNIVLSNNYDDHLLRRIIRSSLHNPRNE